MAVPPEVEFHMMKKGALQSKAFDKLTRQQEKYVFHRLNGCSVVDAREKSGYTREGKDIARESPKVAEALSLLRQDERERIGITREVITDMMLEDRAMSVTATESLACAVQLGKLHGVFEADKQRAAPNTIINLTQNKMEILSDDELLKQASIGLDSLVPQELVEYHEIEDEKSSA